MNYSQAPVIRAYTLSVPAFDHLKATQRDLQANEAQRVTNSAALETLVSDHATAHRIAARLGAPLADLLAAIDLGVLSIVPSASLRDINAIPDGEPLRSAICRAVAAAATWRSDLRTASAAPSTGASHATV